MKKRAVAYIRVSTKSEAQMHSFDYQNEYWKSAIEPSVDNEFLGVYADNGISGKSIYNRPQFMRMIQDALDGKIDVIYTKSVARFGRNTEELLSTVRSLREKGVKVIFEKEQIDTSKPNCELFLTVAAAVAENDLKIYSTNLKWSFREKFAKGFIFIGSKMLGYRMNRETNTLEIVPEEAELVRRIFELYLSGTGLQKIAHLLTEEKIPNVRGEVMWNKNSISYILKNEKYIGAALMQKTVSNLGYIKLNKGEAKQFYMPDTHAPIIDKDTFERVGAIMTGRTPKKLVGGKQPVYAFSHLIECGVCGAKFAHAIRNPGRTWQSAIWKCQTYDKKGKAACDSTGIKDSVLKAKFIECYNEFVRQRYENDQVEISEKKFKVLIEQEQELNMLRVNRTIALTDYKAEIDIVRSKMQQLRREIEKYKIRVLAKEDFQPITDFNEEKVHKFIEKVTIHRNVVTFIFINGVQISRPYTNGQAGNQKGWLEKRNRGRRNHGNSKQSSSGTPRSLQAEYAGRFAKRKGGGLRQSQYRQR